MHRLPAPLSPAFRRGDKVRFTADHRTVEGFTHESLAAAILASGRTTLSRSLRFHRPRAMFCSTGECGWCAVEVDGIPNVMACAVPCREGLSVRSQNAWPSAEWDIFAPLDLASPFLGSTFYHHRFLRPKLLRQFYLRCLRFFTGLGRVAPVPQGLSGAHPRRGAGPGVSVWPNSPTGKARESRETQVAVVGGGLAGVSAALGAAEHGARVILVDDGEALGGGFPGCAPGDPQEGVRKLLPRALQLPNLEYWPRSQCVGFYEPRMLGVLRPNSLSTLQADQIILAPGALDGLPLYLNNDLPGVFSARLVERLLLQEGVAPGRRAVVWGTPALAQRVIAVMAEAGIEIARRLRDGEVILAARGMRQVRAVVIRGSRGQTETVPCDLVVIASRRPRHELLAQAGAHLDWDVSVGGVLAIRDQLMETTVGGLRLVGGAAGSADPARSAAEGRLAGLAAASALGHDAGSELDSLAREVAQMARDPIFPFPAASAVGDGFVCFCEDVREHEIHREMNHGYGLPELVKRRTGVVTGPCQGKFCLANTLRLCGQGGAPPTARPPAKPIRLGALVVNDGRTGFPRGPHG